MNPQQALKAWRKAEKAYRKESRRYIVVRDASEPFEPPEKVFTEEAAAQLTSLREAAQKAQDAYHAAVMEQR